MADNDMKICLCSTDLCNCWPESMCNHGSQIKIVSGVLMLFSLVSCVTYQSSFIWLIMKTKCHVVWNTCFYSLTFKSHSDQMHPFCILDSSWFDSNCNIILYILVGLGEAQLKEMIKLNIRKQSQLECAYQLYENTVHRWFDLRKLYEELVTLHFQHYLAWYCPKLIWKMLWDFVQKHSCCNMIFQGQWSSLKIQGSKLWLGFEW